ncbi:MAG: DUF3810 domain-containing protein [Clostridiales bacterium]|nr:DUF3810 domain-containing protein [Clostridiales bacterium]
MKNPMNNTAGFTITNAVPKEVKRRDFKTIYIRFFTAAIVFIIMFLFISESLHSEVFMYQCTEFSKKSSSFIATFFSMFSFSFAELLVYSFLLFWLVYLIIFIRRLIMKGRRAVTCLRFFSLCVLTFSIILFLFTVLWGLNYLSDPLSKKLTLDVKETSSQKLIKATEISLEYANHYSTAVKRDKEGKCSFGSFSEMAGRSRNVEISLMNRFNIFKAPYCPLPKAVLSSKIMSYFGITGIYFPFTGESNVNTDYVTSSIPFVMTHELSHRLGVAREDEANFAAFLACTGSADADFIYSGYLCSYIYALNQVYEISPDTARQIMAKQSSYVSSDIRDINDFSLKYEGPVSEAGDQINNTYLKSMGQADGIKSYGRMVDLLIAYYNSSLFSNKLSK